jgi:hypothetical protein
MNALSRSELLHFARANLPQSGCAAQPHVAARIAALQFLKRTNHALHGWIAIE